MKTLLNKLIKNIKDKGLIGTLRTAWIYVGIKLDTPQKQKKKLKKYIKRHNKAYGDISKIAMRMNNGVHPKHKILDYVNFFLDNIENGDYVLDAGCGQGQVAYKVAEKASQVIGVDMEDKNIKNCKKNFQRENLKYIVVNLNDYEPEKKFDKIILSNVLEHIEKRVDLLKKMSDFSDTILLRVPMITRDWVTVYKKNMGFEYRLDKTHFVEYSLENLKKEINESGWRIENYQINWGEFWGVLTTDN